MRTIIILFVCLTNLCAVLPLSAQISFGGKPLFINHSEATDLRSEQAIPVVEMPVFDLDSALRLDKINEQNMRGSFTFAHKFYTKIRKETDGENGVLPDGTKYWRVAIHSSKAYSINLLFTKFRLPEGGKLFIYNTDFSHVIGAFDSRNNSDDGILPVRPVSGEEIIVEYSEPADAPFEAELEIGEVNHDYRDILRNEPANDNNATINFACMADAICEAADNPNTRAVVLLIINGTSGCTGTLINNAENDGTPYLLTAVHCLNSEIAHSVSKNKDFYIARAGTIIAFFNYQRPICGSSLRATEEMTLARTYPRTIMEKQDIALLEFQERPPFYYNAYYAGWNASDDTTTVKAAKPFTNLHHPMHDLKRYNRSNNDISITSFKVAIQGYPPYQFEEKSHWKVPRWSLGSTWNGSSGSPLFDNNNLIIGALTSGESACSGNKPNGQWDVFSILYKGWDINNDFETVKSRLNPNNRNIQQQPGFDPHAQNPLQRIGNVNYTSENQLIKTEYAAPNSGNLFGTNNLQTAEYAEEFHLEKDALLHGAYLFLPPLTNTIADVKIKIYTGNNAPETLLDEKTFLPQYLNYNGSFYLANKNMATKTENFVPFDGLQVGKKFWIAYAIGSNTSNFAVCNTQFDSPETPNTAWIKDAQGNWTPAGQYAPQPTKTSLAIQALLTNKEGVAITPIAQNRWEIVYQRAENRLILPDESEGMISIYSANGQLQQQIPVVRGQKSVVIRPSAKGSIGIVRWTNEKSTLIGKIIY